MLSSKALTFISLFLSAMMASAIPLPRNYEQNDLAARRSGDHHGVATYYYPNGAFGSCGTHIQNGDKAVALSTGEYQGGNLCGKRITVTDTDSGRSVSGVVVRDLCPGCQSRDGNKNNIDLTSGVFQQLDNLGKGVINVNWKFD